MKQKNTVYEGVPPHKQFEQTKEQTKIAISEVNEKKSRDLKEGQSDFRIRQSTIKNIQGGVERKIDGDK